MLPGSGGRRSLRPQDWDLREPARQYGERLEEMGSDEDDGQGVYLDPNGYAYRDPRQRGYAGDELYFTGHDLGQHRRESYPNAYYGEGDSEDDGYYRGAAAYNGRDEALAQSAYERIARARAQGQTNINLSVEEMEALERRRVVQQPAPVQPPPLQIASPPATPVKTTKGKTSARNNSSVSLTSQKGKKKSSSLFGSSSPAKSKTKSSRKNSVSSDQAPPFSPAVPPPGYVLAGPNGMPMPMPMPMYAPMPYYPPPSPELSRAQSTRDRSRSTSKHNRRGSTPPEAVYSQYSPRFYPPSGGMRPGSSSSNRSFQDEADWYAHAAAAASPLQPTGRSRAGSSAQYRMPDDYAGPPMPAAQGRRSLGGSGSPDVNYSALRRVPPGSSPLAARPGAPTMHYSDPAVTNRKGSGLSQEVDSASTGSGSSSSDDQGVQVDVRADAKGNGYTVGKTSTKASDARRRKSRR